MMNTDTLVTATSCGFQYRAHALSRHTPSEGEYYALIMHCTLPDWSSTQSGFTDHMPTSSHKFTVNHSLGHD